jgi:prolipoprotein diacylglyceryltransferase
MNTKTLRKIFAPILFVLIMLGAVEVSAQCSMCRAVAESGHKEDPNKVARGLNNGILYLLSMPYILGGVAYFIWRRNKSRQQA